MIADLGESLRVALRGLVANKMRSGLTMLGVVIGVASVIALMSIGSGAQASITEQINDVGSNLVMVMPSGSNGQLTDEDVETIADQRFVPDALVVAPEFGRSTQVIFGNEDVNVSVTGITPQYPDAVSGVEVTNGRFIEKNDVDTRSNVAVIGYDVAVDLFGGFDPVGKKIKVVLPGGTGDRISLTVVGVLEESGDSMLSSTDSAVFVPLSTAQTKIFDGRSALGEPLVTQITVVATAEDRADKLVDDITWILRERHAVASDEDDDFTVISQADLLDMTSQVTGIMTTFLGAIAGISLLVGGIGIMNIMLVSVTERTREIGLRKAVGARRSDILTQFLLEAVLLSAVGGILGILLGVGLASLVNLSGLMEALVTADSVLLAVGFSLAIGIFFGIYPANQAARLNPIDALRYE